MHLSLVSFIFSFSCDLRVLTWLPRTSALPLRAALSSNVMGMLALLFPRFGRKRGSGTNVTVLAMAPKQPLGAQKPLGQGPAQEGKWGSGPALDLESVGDPVLPSATTETISQPNRLSLASVKITFQTSLTQEKHESQDVLSEKCIMLPDHGKNDNDLHYEVLTMAQDLHVSSCFQSSPTPWGRYDDDDDAHFTKEETTLLAQDPIDRKSNLRIHTQQSVSRARALWQSSSQEAISSLHISPQ